MQTLSGLSSAQKAERRQQTGRPGAPSTAALHTPPAIECALTRADSRVRLDRPLGVSVPSPPGSNTKGFWVSAGSAMKTDLAS